jgi:hypothetical protein
LHRFPDEPDLEATSSVGTGGQHYTLVLFGERLELDKVLQTPLAALVIDIIRRALDRLVGIIICIIEFTLKIVHVSGVFKTHTASHLELACMGVQGVVVEHHSAGYGDPDPAVKQIITRLSQLKEAKILM